MRVPAPTIAARAGLAHLALPFDEAAIRPMPALLQQILGSGITAITVGTTVFVSRERFDGMVEGQERILFAHELIHVAQWEAEGAPRFLYRYVTDYVRLRMLGLGHKVAYRHIGYEWDAYEQSARIVHPT